MNQDALAKLFFTERQKADSHLIGRVAAVNSNGSYQVRLNASDTTTRCAACCEAAIGDKVLVLVMKNGHCIALAKLLSS